MGILILGLTLGMTCKKRNQPPSSFFVTFGYGGGDYGLSVQQTSDGGYIVAGTTMSYGAGGEDVWFIKTDASGNRVWDRTFGGTADDEGNSVQQTFDGGYIITGYTKSLGAGGEDVWLIKTDASGNEMWDKTFGETGVDWGNAVRQTSDGGFIITGATTSRRAGSEEVWLIKTDASGNEVWDKSFGGNGASQGWSVRQTTDGGYVVVGWTMSASAGGPSIWLIKTDSSGDKVWDETLGGVAYSVQQTSDGGYVIAGSISRSVMRGPEVWLVKTDASGNEVWDRTFGGPRENYGYSLQQTTDGGYIIVGSTRSYGAGGEDVWLIKTDASGKKTWDKTVGWKGDEDGRSVQQTSDGGYIIAGSTSSCGTASQYLLLLKVDAGGNLHTAIDGNGPVSTVTGRLKR